MHDCRCCGVQNAIGTITKRHTSRPIGAPTFQDGDVATVFSLRGVTDDLMRSFEAD
jgi:hypothetical protein